VFWSDAAAELGALAHALRIPVYSRRAAQGALPETDPLAVAGAWKKPITGAADVVVSIGFAFWSGEHFGRPPTWSREATHVQIDASPARIGWHVPAAVPIVADPKRALAQLHAAATAAGPSLIGPARDAWLARVAEARRAHAEALDAEEAAVHDAVPIHPARFVHDLVAAMDDDATVVVDSFTLSGWVSQRLRARFPGQIVDAGPLAPVGHGVGMGIGAQLARPGKQVLVVIGDGGLGIGGLEIETALRCDLPIVVLVWNNGSWGPSFDQMPMLRGRVDPFEMLPGLRYDRMFEAIGCHGEHVERPEEIRPALARAFAAGKAAVVNVIGDARVGHPRLGGNLLGSTTL
jgi:acetolactate synthase-1/2/3 large subunit